MIHHNNLAPEKKADGVEAFETPSDLQVYIYIYIYICICVHFHANTNV